jgi:hypothetical protein
MLNHHGVTPAFVAGIHVSLGSRSPPQGVDGRDKPGHDGAEKFALEGAAEDIEKVTVHTFGLR